MHHKLKKVVTRYTPRALGSVLRRKKKEVILTLFGIVVAVCVGVYVARHTIATFVWNKTHFEHIALILDPQDAVLRESIGSFYFTSEHYDIDKAETYFKKAIAINDHVPLAHYQLARVHFIHGDFSDAITEINTEIVLYPEYKRSHYIRGLVYGYMGNFDFAIEDFKEFLKWKKDSWAGHNDLSWVYFKKGDFASARDVAMDGLVYTPHNPWLLNSLGVALLNLNNRAQAKSAFKESLAQFDQMKPADWGRAYPGNNPKIYIDGFGRTRSSIESNLVLSSN